MNEAGLLGGGTVGLTEGGDLWLLGRVLAPMLDRGPAFDMDAPWVSNRLAALFGLGVPQGRTVHLLRDGSVTENDPDGVVLTWEMVRRTFWGGHVHGVLTREEADLLAAAGYEVLP